MTPAVLRGAALFLAAFTAVGLIGEVRGRTLDVSLWWVDLHDLPDVVRQPLLAVLAGLLAAGRSGRQQVRAGGSRPRRCAPCSPASPSVT